MKTGIIISILFIDAVLSDIVFGASITSSFERNSLLPWRIIAEKFHEGCWFSSEEISPNNDAQKYKILRINRADSNSSYTCLPTQPIIIKLPEETVDFGSLNKITVKIAEFYEGSWRNIGETITRSESNEIRFTSGISKEGFYRLSFSIVTQDGKNHNLQAYTIVSLNWKKDILASCREMKEKLELNPDAQLIRSSITVSHFDHTMEMVSKSTFLSGKILKALADTLQSKKSFDSGLYPDFVIGLNKIRLKRFEGALIEVFTIVVPRDYKRSETWPVFIHIGNISLKMRKENPIESNLIDIWWHTASSKDIRWKEFESLMVIVEKKLCINENRIYLDGECADAIPAMAMALHYPDYWAECSVSLGNSCRYLAGNALNLPLIFIKTEHDQDSLVGYYDFAVKCFRYYGCRRCNFSYTKTIIEARGRTLPEVVRENNPMRVLYTIESLENPKAYWINIEGRVDENLLSTLDANVSEQTVIVKTANVDAYSLNLAQAPLDANEPIEIFENGQSLGFVKDQAFTRRSKKYINAKHIKNKYLHGPVWDAFTDPYIVVRGASDEDKELIEINKQIAKSLAGDGPVFTDANVPEKYLNSHNLILVGTEESNLLLSKISRQLPVLIEDNDITAEGKRYNGPDMGFILIYPNPLNDQKYVAVFSGTSPQAIAKMPETYSQIKSVRPIDIGIFELTDTGDVKWHIFEKFNTVWDWHHDWDRVLFTMDKNHPKWQWRQWIAKAVRKQLKADVVVLENPFMFENSIMVGQITYRDLFNTFENLWFIKVSMKGKALRELLTISFEDVSKKDTDALIIVGISLVSNPASSGEEALTINELIDDVVYSVVLPEKCLNGRRMGVVVQDYWIEDQKYLIPILKEYLAINVNDNIEAQLDSLKFKVF